MQPLGQSSILFLEIALLIIVTSATFPFPADPHLRSPGDLMGLAKFFLGGTLRPIRQRPLSYKSSGAQQTVSQSTTSRESPDHAESKSSLVYAPPPPLPYKLRQPSKPQYRPPGSFKLRRFPPPKNVNSSSGEASFSNPEGEYGGKYPPNESMIEKVSSYFKLLLPTITWSMENGHKENYLKNPIHVHMSHRRRLAVPAPASVSTSASV